MGRYDEHIDDDEAFEPDTNNFDDYDDFREMQEHLAAQEPVERIVDESIEEYEQVESLREQIGDELLEVTLTDSEDVPQYIEPHHIFADGTRVKLKGVSPLAVDYLQTVEVNKPVPPRVLQGKHRPEPPERIKTENGVDVSFLDYEDARYKKSYQAWLNDRNIKKRLLPDENDSTYLAALQTWQEARERKLIRYLAINGVEDTPPYEWMLESTPILPENFSDSDAKYLWLAEKMKTPEEISRFYQAVAGVTMPTAQGIEESKNGSL